MTTGHANHERASRLMPNKIMLDKNHTEIG